jgi:hypothetical protein
LTLPRGRVNFAFDGFLLMKPKLILTVSLIACSASPLVAQQRFFFFEEPKPFKHPVKIPTAALQVMRHEIENRRGCNVNQATNLSGWFFGSRIDLAPSRRAFILRSHQV